MSNAALKWAFGAPIQSHGQKLLLALLADYANKDLIAWPSQDTLAKTVCADRKSIVRWLAALERSGYIARERRGGDGHGRATNVYRLLVGETGKVPLVPFSHEGQSPTGDTIAKSHQCHLANGSKVPMPSLAKSQPDPSKVPLVPYKPLIEASLEPLKEDLCASLDFETPASEAAEDCIAACLSAFEAPDLEADEELPQRPGPVVASEPAAEPSPSTAKIRDAQPRTEVHDSKTEVAGSTSKRLPGSPTGNVVSLTVVKTPKPKDAGLPFDDFYALYPRKKGKAEAAERWQKLPL